MSHCWLPALGLTLVASVATAETLDLEQAIDRALVHDPRIEEVEHLVGVARTWVDEAQGHRGWTLDVNAIFALSPAVDGGFFERGGCAPGDCEVRSDRFESNGLSLWSRLELSLVKPLHTFGKVEHYSEAARANVEVKQGDVRLQRGVTALDVKRAYFGYLAARDARLVLEDVKKRVDGAVASVEEWLLDGERDIRQSDLYALQAGAALVGRYLAQSAGLERIALDGLKVLTGVGLGHELEVADKRLTPVSLPEVEMSEAQQQALAQRPEMAQVEAGLRARRALVEANKAEGRPDIYAGAAGLLSYSPNRDRLDNPHIFDPFNDVGLTPLVGLRWDWNAGVRPARIARAQAELEALLAKSSLARQGIPFQVAEQYHQVQAHYEAVAELENASRASRRWMIAGFADFEAGMEKGDKVITALQGYVFAHTDYLQTVFGYNMHVAQLLNVMGVER